MCFIFSALKINLKFYICTVRASQFVCNHFNETKMQDLDTLSLNKATTHPFGTFYLVLFSSLFQCNCSVCGITCIMQYGTEKNFGSPFFYILYFILEAKILMRQISYLYLRLKQFLRPHIYLLCL